MADAWLKRLAEKAHRARADNSLARIPFPRRRLSGFEMRIVPRRLVSFGLALAIAGAGIVVRNSIILVDFIELRRRQGMALREAVIDAGAVRFRPMLLTATAVIQSAFTRWCPMTWVLRRLGVRDT